MNLKKFINDTYGSGSELKMIHVTVILLSCTSISLLMFFYINPNSISNGLPTLINKLFIYYLEALIFCFGLLFLSLYFYCKPIPKVDRFKKIKVVFAFISLIYLGILFLPYVAITAISNSSGKILKIEKLITDIIHALIAIIAWIILLYFFLVLSCGLGDILRIRSKLKFPTLYNIVGVKAVVYYGMFISMLLSNKITKVFYFKISKIQNLEIKKQVNHQMKLFWYYMVFLVSFIVKPLDFNNTDVELFFDALFYSSATIALLSKAVEWRNKTE